EFGVMYFGNVNSILRFNNDSWESFTLRGTPILKAGSHGEIYAGGYNALALIKSNYSKASFNKIPIPEHISIGQVENIIIINNQVLFIGSNIILSYQNKKVKEVYSSQESFKVFEVNESLYITSKSLGIHRMNPNDCRTSPIENNTFFHGREIVDIFSANPNELIIKCINSDNFFIHTPNRIQYWASDADNYIKNNVYVKTIITSEGTFITGTEYGGIICFDENGKYKFILNKKHGLLDNRITDLFICTSNDLWLTTYNGICHIDYPSPISYYNTSYGINGAISTMYRYKGTLYLGGTQGLYYYNSAYTKFPEFYKYNDEFTFIKFKDIVAEVHHICEIKKQLYLSTSRGIYKLIDNNNVELVEEGDYRYLLPSVLFKNHIYAVGRNGVNIFTKDEGKLKFAGTIEDLDYELRTIVEDKESKTVWLGSNNDGLFKLNYENQNIYQPVITNFNESNGLPKDFIWIDVYNIENGIIFSTQNGVFEYSNGEFIKNKIFENISKQGIEQFFPIYEKNLGNIWFSSVDTKTANRVTGYANIDNNNNLDIHTSDFNSLHDVTVESIFCDKDSVIWFGSFDDLVRFDISKRKQLNKNKKFLILKTNLVDSIENSLFDLMGNQKHIPSLKYSQNQIRFDFTALFYSSHKNIEYKTILEGFQDDWSNWSNVNFKEFTYLPSGNYTFKVQARDVSGRVSETLEFHFSVMSPLLLRWWAFVFYFLILFSTIYLILKLNSLKHSADKLKLEKVVAERTDELIRQKEQTEKLVQRLLPEQTVEEIQKDGTAQSKRYDTVTVLFADIQGFTKIAEIVDANILVEYLNKIFTTFDSIIAKYEIDKIKTIGDAYMCAGGMRQNDRSTPVEVVLAALQMQDAINIVNKDFSIDFEIRIGIHTGPVIAGVVGGQKIEYDIWGDTVNIASRMESNGIVGKVNMSSATYQHVKDFFECEERGKTTVKYKGDLNMFLAHRIKKELSEYLSGKTPNNDFYLRLQNLRYADLEEFMLQKIEAELPKNLYYHNVRHTVNVISRVEKIGIEEKVSEEDLLLLKTAALFHDAGFIVAYDNNEIHGANIAADILPKYRYTPEQIQIIRDLILATRMPPKPKTKLEEIMCDADLDYLGRPDFIVVSQNLFRELFERHKVSTIDEWNKYQYKFISKHQYFTVTGRKLREEGKKLVLEELKRRI
ncbi:MAG: HD domain-containing protein, partial [Bacteroidales bacterium]|nr:HD domain-containing protein [Bacteroidales bacterium]